MNGLGLSAFADSFNKGLTGGISLFNTLTQQQALQAQNNLSNTIALGKYFQDQAAAQDANPFNIGGGTSLSPGIPQGQPDFGGTATIGYPGLAPQQALPLNQLFTPINQNPGSTVTAPAQAVSDPLANFYRSDIPTAGSSRQVYTFAAMQRKRIKDLGLPKQTENALLSQIDNIQQTGKPDLVKSFEASIPKPQDVTLKGDPESEIQAHQRRLALIQDYAKYANKESVQPLKYGTAHLPFGITIPGFADVYQAVGGKLSTPDLQLGDIYDKLSLQEGLVALGGKIPREGSIQRVYKDIPSPSQSYENFPREFKDYALGAKEAYEKLLNTYSEQYLIPEGYKKALQDFESDPNVQRFVGEQHNNSQPASQGAQPGVKPTLQELYKTDPQDFVKSYQQEIIKRAKAKMAGGKVSDPQPGVNFTPNQPSQSQVDIPTLINQAADKYKLDPRLLQALVRQESGGNPRARSNAGAKGVMQLMPATAKAFGVKDPYNAAQNIEAGARYLSQLIQKYNGDVAMALAHYNGGGGAVQHFKKKGGIGIRNPYAPANSWDNQTAGYVNNILGAL